MFTGTDMKFTIGRNGDNDFIIDNDTVSSDHAEILVSDDFKNFTLIDLESTNGTYVNELEIVSKKITAKDIIQLGSHRIDQDKLFDQLLKYIKSQRTDFSPEFGQLLKMESAYKTKRRSLNKNYRLMAMMPRLIVTVLVVVVIYFFPNIKSELRYPLMIGATFLGSTISTLGISERKKEELMDKLKTEFQLNFVCPKCGSELSGKEGIFWKEKKACRNKQCNATWQIKS